MRKKREVAAVILALFIALGSTFNFGRIVGKQQDRSLFESQLDDLFRELRWLEAVARAKGVLAPKPTPCKL
jgi:hypothetical protein